MSLDRTRELQLAFDSEFLQAEYLEVQAAESPELQLVLAPEFLQAAFGTLFSPPWTWLRRHCSRNASETRPKTP